LRGRRATLVGMELGLANKVALITGASGGIGRALMEGFAAEGAKLVLVGGSRTPELEAYVEARPWRDSALCIRADVSKLEEVESAFARGAERFGRLDIAVANAGLWPRPDELLHRASEARIRGALDANLFGSLWTARAFMATLERTRARADGHGAALVFIGSTAGRFGERGHADYATAKAALHGLMLSLKNEIVRLDPFARVNLVEPGWTMTHMARADLETPGVIENVTRTMALRQIGRAADVARTVLFLSSPLAARHISGETLTVAGGMEGRSLWKSGEIDEAAVRARLATD
jgi:3-oxoacyl-[acyl-carrier protein] reductase